MNAHLKLPLYAKASLILVGLYALISMLSVSRGIILPLIFAIIIAILISPLVNFMVSKRIHRNVAISVVFFTAIIILGGLLALVASQASNFINAMPQLADRLEELLNHTVSWCSGYFNISPVKINSWLDATSIEFIKKINTGIGDMLASMGGTITAAFLTPVYILMILFYQPHLIQFVHKLFRAGHHDKVSQVMSQTKSIIQSYLIGLSIETGIVAILNSAGLLVLGIDYAILLGIGGALLNMIPYIGGIIGVIIYVLIVLVTKPPMFVLYILLLYAFIQFIDNYYIVPKIIGSKVKLNALISIIAVIAGAALWGIPGMFLAIPLIAIVKLILDNSYHLNYWGELLGDSKVPITKIK